MRFEAKLAPSWRPKRLQNRGRNPKKSMLKNNTFLTSILRGFGRRFGRIFGRFFGPKMHAKSEEPKYVKSQQNIAWAHVFLMLAFATSIKFQAKIDEKSHVCWDIDFGGILGRFWESFGRSKTSIFAFFSIFFGATFGRRLGSQKIEKKSIRRRSVIDFGPARRNVHGPGER